jgi:hypothetical protein
LRLEWQKPNNADSSARFLIEQALNIAEGYAHVFSELDISKCFYLLAIRAGATACKIGER